MSEHRKQFDRKNLPPTVLTIFGVTGSLSQSKLLPALYHLLERDMFPDNFRVIGIARKSSISIDELLQKVEINLLRKRRDVNPEILKRLKELITPIIMDSTSGDDYLRLRDLLDQMNHQDGMNYQRLFYLAIPPEIFPQVIGHLRNANLHAENEGVARRILVEKPFGMDYSSATSLVNVMSESFSEQQIYRIDHYLAKENAQNILTFRFNNPFVEDLWGRQFIDHIQISACEKIDIESRGNFYEGMGALRDIVQSHLLQLMALVMMEAPEQMTSDAIHREKLLLLNAIKPINPTHVDELTVRGQYEGYADEAENPASRTETYAALSLEVENPRWGGVPILMRTGKALDQQKTEISVVFKDRSRRSVPPNVLTIRIQPDEGISILLTAKQPGFDDELRPVKMQFTYQESFENDGPDAYERVLIDCIAGDQSLFATSDEVLRCWEILEPVLEHWSRERGKLSQYAKGSYGPPEADALVAGYNSWWM